MFRRKRSETATVGKEVRPTPAADTLQTVYLRVLQSFLVDTPRPLVTPPGSFGAGTISPPPSATGQTAPPPVNAPGAAFVGEIAGGDASSALNSTGGSDGSVNVPGLGAVTHQQLKAAEARAQAAIQEALGSADLSHLTPGDAQAVQARLEEMRAGGRLTDQQYVALNDGLAALTGSPQS